MVKKGFIRILDAMLASILIFVLLQVSYEVYLNKESHKIVAIKQSYKSCTGLMKDLRIIFPNSNIYVYNLTNNQLICKDIRQNFQGFSEINVDKLFTKLNYTLVLVKVIYA